MTQEQQHDKDEASQPRPGDEIAPSRYRKLPVEIEAIRWCGTNLKAVIDFTGRHPSADEWTWAQFEEVVRTKGLKIFTLEGHHMASVGDYIIKGVHGEFYPCKPDIFWKTYERATAPLPESGTNSAAWQGPGLPVKDDSKPSQEGRAAPAPAAPATPRTVLPSKEMEELQTLAGELRTTSKWRVSSAQRTILLNAADAVAALWHIKSADAIASRSATGTLSK